MGQTQHTTAVNSSTTHRRRPRERGCLCKGCEQRYRPVRPNQRYCGPDCRRLVKQWQGVKRQRRHRRKPEARRKHQEAQRKRRLRQKEEKAQPQKEAPIEPPRGNAGQEIFPHLICDRPGCYEPPRRSFRAPSFYCSDACRLAVRRVLDRERKWWLRRTLQGRMERRYEYARRAPQSTYRGRAP